MNRFFLFLMQIILTVKRNLLIKPLIHKDMVLIADFGCGHFPNKHANVLVDQAASADIQRGGFGIRKKKSSVFYNVDLNVFPYPFADKYFDFLICSHVLEHLEDPVRTCSELSRIAKAGYIEVPYYSVDLYIRNNDPIHKWLCGYDPRKEIIHFIERNKFLETMRPRQINILLRFLMQLKSLCVVWKDNIQGDYLSINPYFK
ncbi:class I SAM-dependent methyltransferase [Geomonas azotofigens]|uniref:class I SAM-dependent methyltransferase n=1 Tax=Geomonas azotofigens TaxID=2843196 RepID=UPI001C0F5CF6|nr:methyltransferase domain-containing protein [Geomonas azotofigens]MBU5612487.1 class I SAM-dependent methyltransferase [Geomonas azotofigens]